MVKKELSWIALGANTYRDAKSITRCRAFLDLHQGRFRYSPMSSTQTMGAFFAAAILQKSVEILRKARIPRPQSNAHMQREVHHESGCSRTVHHQV